MKYCLQNDIGYQECLQLIPREWIIWSFNLFLFLFIVYLVIERLIGKLSKKGKSYGLLKFEYKSNIKLVKKTQQRAIRDHNLYVRNFKKAHKRNPNRYELGRIVRGASHETISYGKGKGGHWKRQWVRQYIYGLHKISYTKR
ncbi:hypothetical protein HN532_01105 [archaeon]|jgi:hypothetical protein|nr:hypothetical protein [archaeon]